MTQMTYLLLTAKPTDLDLFGQIGALLFLFFLAVGLVALLTAFLTNLYCRMHLTRMRNQVKRDQEAEKYLRPFIDANNASGADVIVHLPNGDRLISKGKLVPHDPI